MLPTTQAAPPARTIPRILFLLLAALCLGGCLLGIVAAARAAPQSSDTVPSFLAAQDILRGNLLLSGWHLPVDSFIFADTLFFVVVLAVFGAKLATLVAIPAATYGLILVVALMAAWRKAPPYVDNLVALAVIILLAGLPAGDAYVSILVPDTHSIPILLSLVALILMALLARAPRVRDRPLLAAWFLVISIAVLGSDPFALIFAYAPMLLVLGVDLLVAGAGRRRHGLLGLALASCALGGLVPSAISAAGGFVTEPSVTFGFATVGYLWRNAQGVFFGLLSTAGADLWGRHVLATGWAPNAIRLAVWLLGIVAVCWRLRTRLFGTERLLDRLLAASVGTVLLACLVSREFFFSGSSTRYLVPVLFFGAVLAARAIPDLVARLPVAPARRALAGGLVALAGILLAVQMGRSLRLLQAPGWVADNPEIQTGRMLAAQGLTCGVGDYWAASIITVLTGSKVTVRAVTRTPQGRLMPYLWVAKAGWYRQMGPPMFAIWSAHGSLSSHVDRATVTATYGPPQRIEQVGPYKIAVLSRPAGPDAQKCGR